MVVTKLKDRINNIINTVLPPLKAGTNFFIYVYSWDVGHINGGTLFILYFFFLIIVIIFSIRYYNLLLEIKKFLVDSYIAYFKHVGEFNPGGELFRIDMYACLTCTRRQYLKLLAATTIIDIFPLLLSLKLFYMDIFSQIFLLTIIGEYGFVMFMMIIIWFKILLLLYFKLKKEYFSENFFAWDKLTMPQPRPHIIIRFWLVIISIIEWCYENIYKIFSVFKVHILNFKTKLNKKIKSFPDLIILKRINDHVNYIFKVIRILIDIFINFAVNAVIYVLYNTFIGHMVLEYVRICMILFKSVLLNFFNTKCDIEILENLIFSSIVFLCVFFVIWGVCYIYLLNYGWGVDIHAH